jgi:hypothetical protein
MKPRWHFVLRTSLLVLGTILAALTLLYITSFILFVLRQTGVFFVPGFGFHGLGIFFSSLPWLLVFLALVCALLLEVLIRKYSFGYGKPLMYSLLGILLLVIAGSFLVEQTSFHRGLFKHAEQDDLPLAGGFYRQYVRHEFNSITSGVIIEQKDQGFNLRSNGGEVVGVTITPQTHLPYGQDFENGDFVIVIGQRKNNTVTADGIMEFEAEVPPPPMPIMTPDMFWFRSN